MSLPIQPPHRPPQLPVADPDAGAAVNPASAGLLNDLQANLWQSLRHTVDLDRVTIGALWLSNFGGMILAVIAGQELVPFGATMLALGVVDFFIYRLFKTSQTEARRVVALLSDIYTDHGLGKYFDQMREEFFVERYSIRLALCPVLWGLALVLGVAFGG